MTVDIPETRADEEPALRVVPGVVVEVQHLCMTKRGVRARGSTTLTSALRGRLREDPRTRQEFLALVSG